MKLDFSKKQYENLLKMGEIADWVYGILGDAVSEDYKKQSQQIEKLQQHLLSLADQFGCDEMAEKYKGEIIPSDEFLEEMQAVMGDYDDQTFWHELETRLGRRDFEKDITKEERQQAEKDGWLPSRVHDFFDKWSKEFEEHGVERLKIVVEKNEKK